MEPWIGHLLTVVGLVLSTAGAAVVLGADWSTMENRAIKMGNMDPGIYLIPVIGYPFNQAKKLADLEQVYSSLLIAGEVAEHPEENVGVVEPIVKSVDEEKIPATLAHRSAVKSYKFRKATVDNFGKEPKTIMGGERKYINFYDSEGNPVGWIKTKVFQHEAVRYKDNLLSKAGASLFVSGFIFQLVAVLFDTPEYPDISVNTFLIAIFLIGVVVQYVEMRR